MTDLHPGDEVAGRYVLDEKIGEGGMGVVWRATDSMLDRTVALKRVRFTVPDDADAGLARRRVAREARVAARLHHRHAITIFDVIEEAGEPWLVLEYLPSRSLAQLIDERGSLPPAEVARIGEAVADALAAAHAEGIVHRDVKPANVLVGASGAVKLTDFGISRLVGDPTLTATGMLSGTPAYLAPEVAGGADATPASDVFGLGATLYAALEGRPPFGAGADGNVLQALAAAAAGRFPPPQRAGALTGPLLALLAQDPDDRPDAVAAARSLAEVARTATPDRPTQTVDGTVRLPPEDPAPQGSSSGAPGGPPWWRRRGPLAALAVLLVAGLAATLLGARGRGRRPGGRRERRPRRVRHEPGRPRRRVRRDPDR